MPKTNRCILIILDGWGHRLQKTHNAIAEAHTPFFDELWKKYPHTLLNASEHHVGLTKGTIGNSEIGHMTIGAGKIIDTDLVQINKAVAKGDLNKNPVFLSLFNHIKKFNSTLHILGLVSPAGVHSHQEHLYGFLLAAKRAKIKNIVIHAFTDGRDTPPQSANKYLQKLENFLQKQKIGHIASLSGRLFAMDRDNNWHRTQKTLDVIFKGAAKQTYNLTKPSEVLKALYKLGKIDELLEPVIFLDGDDKINTIKANDGVFFFNFRRDRTRQLSKKISEQSKNKNLFFVTMTEYDPKIKSHVAFAQQKPITTLAAEISNLNLKQSHIAETEKYGHVTYFFNGGRQDPYPGEKDFLIASRKDILTHDQAPEMRAKEICDTAIKRIVAKDDFILINFANADMVGHTANKQAIIKAVETIDLQLKKLIPIAQKNNYNLIITADHGNAELNVDQKTHEKHTAHTLNKVPFILVTNSLVSAKRLALSAANSLADIAPTILNLMGLKIPKEMSGKSLIISK